MDRKPRNHHLLKESFAFALVAIDGTNSAMLHMIANCKEDELEIGKKVKKWFGMKRSHKLLETLNILRLSMTEEKKDFFVSDISLSYQYTAGNATTRFLNKVAEGKLVTKKCPKCSAVYVPPRGSCPRCGIATKEELELPDTGARESFTIVHIPIPGNPIVPPYVSAMIRLDGADISFLHLIQEIDLADIRIGMRVQAVWKDKSEVLPWKILNGSNPLANKMLIRLYLNLKNERYIRTSLRTKSNCCRCKSCQ